MLTRRGWRGCTEEWTAGNERTVFQNHFISLLVWLDLGFIFFSHRRRSSFDFLYPISKTTSGGREGGSSAWTCLSLFIVRPSLWLSSSHKADQIQISLLVKISHFLPPLPPPNPLKAVYRRAKCLVRSDLSPVLLQYPRLTKSGLYN